VAAWGGRWMDQKVGLKQSFIRWWRRNWVLLVAKLAMPIALVTIIFGIGLAADPEYGGGLCSCSWAPTSTQTYEQQLAALATDVFIGQVEGITTEPKPALPKPGTSPTRPLVNLDVVVIETVGGTATGTLVVRYAFRMERYNHGVTNVKVGDVLFFYTVQGEPTGTHTLIAGPYFYYSATPLSLPMPTPIWAP
jgi:hypothetical protein